MSFIVDLSGTEKGGLDRRAMGTLSNLQARRLKAFVDKRLDDIL
jgi:hypothetical protein